MQLVYRLWIELYQHIDGELVYGESQGMGRAPAGNPDPVAGKPWEVSWQVSWFAGGAAKPFNTGQLQMLGGIWATAGRTVPKSASSPFSTTSNARRAACEKIGS